MLKTRIVILAIFTALIAAACQPADTPTNPTADAPADPPADTPADPIGETITTASGLQYIDEVIGTGISPEVGDFVNVHYVGTLEDGTKFDSSVDRGQPFGFQLGVGNVIQGWDEGVATMRVGGKRRLIIPPDLAYGDTGAGDAIPPNATIIFEVELLSVPRLEVEIIEEGDGPMPQTGDIVSVHYTGTLEDGTVFDSSVERGQPIEFPIGMGRVILGWDQGIMEMKVGGKRILTIPPELAYGPSGRGDIPPNATLIFEVELLDIQN